MMETTKKMTILRPLRGWTELVQVVGVESREEIHRLPGQMDKARIVLTDAWDAANDIRVKEKGRWCVLYKSKKKYWAVSGSYGHEPDCCIEYQE